MPRVAVGAEFDLQYLEEIIAMKPLIAMFACALTWATYAAPSDDARALFDRYVQLERQFDPAVADLYADDALIKNTRRYPNGQVREATMPAPRYKGLIRQAMPTAKARSDTSSYTEVRFTEERTGVRITATRFSHLKQYSSPLSLFVAPDASGRWLIREELSESQP
jgi:hypothetical protein